MENFGVTAAHDTGDPGEGGGLISFESCQQGGGERQIVARTGEWTGDGWVFRDVVDTTLPNQQGIAPSRTVTNRLELAELTETPDQIRSSLKVDRLFSNFNQATKRPQLSVKEIVDYRRLLLDASHPPEGGRKKAPPRDARAPMPTGLQDIVSGTHRVGVRQAG